MDEYINDELHEFLGMSDKTLIEYIKSAGNKIINKIRLKSKRQRIVDKGFREYRISNIKRE